MVVCFVFGGYFSARHSCEFYRVISTVAVSVCASTDRLQRGNAINTVCVALT